MADVLRTDQNLHAPSRSCRRIRRMRIRVEATGLDVIASGGIGSDEDVDLIKTSGCAGVIIGKAIYEGKVDLARCLQNV